MKIGIIGTGLGPIVTSKELDELFFGTSTINRKNPLEEAMDKLLNEVKRGEAKTIILDSLGDIVEEIEKAAIGKYNSAPICFDIQSITANHKKNAFTVVWGDGSHTMIHLQPGDIWDDEKALAMCFVKHMMGDTGSFNDIFTKEMPAKIKHIGKIEPIEEKHECKCDTPCEDCSGKKEDSSADMSKKLNKVTEKTIKAKNAFGISKETTDELAKAAKKADASLKNMIEQLTGETVNTNNVKHAVPYKVYIRIGNKSHYDSEHFTIEALRKRIHEIAEEFYGKKPYYYRTWLGNSGRMMIDFGHHSQFIEVEGITPSEYAKNQ